MLLIAVIGLVLFIGRAKVASKRLEVASKQLESTGGSADTQAFFAVIELFTSTPLLLTVTIFAIALLFRGIIMALQPIFVPPDAPEGINGRGYRRYVLPLLQDLSKDDLYLGTYAIPRSSLAVILHSFMPDLHYLTPPRKDAVPSLWFLGGTFASCFAMCVVAVNGGWGLIFVMLSMLCFIAICGVAVYLCGPRRPPSPVVLQQDLTRIDAGNPLALYEKMQHDGFEEIRSSANKVNRLDRMACEFDDTGESRAAIRFKWLICLESEPILVKGNARVSLAGWVLEGSAVVFCLLGAIFALTLPIESCWGLRVAGNVMLCLTAPLLNKAYNLRNTFRWKSDLVAVTADGTMQRQRAGGEDVNFQIQRIHSQMHLTVLATRVITECSSRGVWKPKKVNPEDSLGNLRHALSCPRYLIQTDIDDEFRAKVQSIIHLLQQFHDREGVVMGAEEDSVGAQHLRQNKEERDQERDQKKLMMQMQQQMQMMLFGKVLDKMTPEQMQQMMLQGGGMGMNQLPQPAIPQPALAQPAAPKMASLPPSPPQGQVAPEGERLLRDAYRAYYTLGQTEAGRAAIYEMVKSLINQFRVSPERQRSLQQEVIEAMGLNKR